MFRVKEFIYFYRKSFVLLKFNKSVCRKLWRYAKIQIQREYYFWISFYQFTEIIV